MGNFLINCCCCQHNCLIFPAPRARKGWQFQAQTIPGDQKGSSQIKVELHNFMNSDNEKVPYMQISSQKSRKKKEVIIYFHGNAEDIFHSIEFMIPIFKSVEITILCLQYPTYSCYESEKRYFISDRIKSNSLQFHQKVRQIYSLKPQNIHIIGRSIGTGPASYLASHVYCSKLVLISPFDTIRKVSIGLVGCIGFMVKDHFSNEESILNHQGDLLVIHGRIDQVIKFNHGKALVSVYQSRQTKKTCTFIQPPRMSHNFFDMAQDIVKPIKQFLNS